MNIKFDFEGMFAREGFVADYGYTQAIEETVEVKSILNEAKASDDEEMNEWAFNDWYNDYYEQLVDYAESKNLTKVIFGDDPDTLDIFYTNDVENVVKYIMNISDLTEEEIRASLEIE